MLILTLIAALAAQSPAPNGASATLLEPREGRLNLDGRGWTCDASGQCAGRGGGTTQPLMRECRRFVARMGPVSSFGRGGLELTEAEVAQCNSTETARARRTVGA